MIRIIGLGDNVVDCNYTAKVIYPGGNSFNFAVMGKRLGYEASYAGVIGSDWRGKKIIDVLRKEGVDISACQYAEGETGICGIYLDHGDRTIVDENDAGVVKSHPYQVTDDVLELLENFDIVHSSCFSYIEDQLGKIKKRGIPVLYDFSDIWKEDTLAKICPDVSIAFFSGKEFQSEKLEELLRTCVDEYGCSMAVTTYGERGAMVYNGRKIYEKIPYNFRSPVVDTTGAGDSWITAFITGYFTGMKMSAMMRKGNPENFIRSEDADDYEDRLIEYAMSAGNLFARRNCLIKGSLGYEINYEMG